MKVTRTAVPLASCGVASALLSLSQTSAFIPGRNPAPAAAAKAATERTPFGVATASAFASGKRRIPAASSSSSLSLTFDDGNGGGSARDDDDDDDLNSPDGSSGGLVYDDGSLTETIDAVSWLPSCSDSKLSGSVGSDSSGSNGSKNTEQSQSKITKIRRDSQILPLFPLGTDIYTPHSDHSLSIYESRYVEMYDYLMNADLHGENKQPEFVVTMTHPTDAGSFAQYGVIFRVVDFIEVDDMDQGNGGIVGGSTGSDGMESTFEELEEEVGAVKYVAHHEVTGIVKIHRVLNPSDWETEETYLRAEVSVVDDLSETVVVQTGGGELAAGPEKSRARKWKSDDADDKDGSTSTTSSSTSAGGGITVSPHEQILSLRDLFSALVTIQHDLNEDVRFARSSVDNFARGVGDGPRGFWFTVLSWQQYAEQRILSRHVELQGDFQEKLMDFLGREDGRDAPDSIDVADLPPYLQEEATDVERRVKMELGPLRLELSLGMQRLLEAKDQGVRIGLLSGLVGAELQRLRTKRSMRAIFGTDGDGAASEGDDAGGDEKKDSVATMSPAELKAAEEVAQVEQMRLKLERSFGVTNGGGVGGGGGGGGDTAAENKRDGGGGGGSTGKQKSSQPIFYDDMDAFQ